MGETVTPALRIDGARLQRSLAELARIGAYRDEVAGLVGVNRLALTNADAAGRRQVMRWFEEAGLAVSIDRIGNVYGRRAGRNDALAPVMMGSHIDSVPTGGAFDGALGVLGALEVVRTLNDRGIATRRPLVVAFFTDEEGCRFGTDMLGSAVATGRLGLDDAYALRDRDGRTVREELERIGFLGKAAVDGVRPHCYLECHIEQGPVLRAQGLDIGAVTGVQAIAWWELTITGKSCHAGTTPVEYRRDPGLAAARVNVWLREACTGGAFGDGLRATMGVIRLTPGMVNVVPSRAVATVDLRHPSDAQLARAEAELDAVLRAVERGDGVRIEARRTARTGAVEFDRRLRQLVVDKAAALGLSHMPILSGAGHDAQEWANLTPAAMVFVPGEHDGISHNPREYSTPQQCANGVDVLLALALVTAD